MDDQEVHHRFLLLVEEFRMAAWIGLGKLKDPATGAAERNLDLARHAIDTLGMIEVKTRGNRDEAEERFAAGAGRSPDQLRGGDEDAGAFRPGAGGRRRRTRSPEDTRGRRRRLLAESAAGMSESGKPRRSRLGTIARVPLPIRRGSAAPPEIL